MGVSNDLYDEEVIEAFKFYFILSGLQKNVPHVYQSITKVAMAHPTRLAVKHGDTSLNYGALEERSNIIANYLIDQGVEVETPIAIFLTESALLPICILGILKAGATYVPIATDFPSGRIERIMHDADVKMILTDIGKAASLSFVSAAVMELDLELSVIEEPISTAPSVIITDRNAAYILYTSGSTGNPKGVVVEHGSLAHYLTWYIEDLQRISKVNLPLTSSICFAAAITQLFSPLIMGTTLHILNREMVKQPVLLLKWYEEHPGFGLYCVPTLWEEMINYVEQSGEVTGRPDCIYLSGEALSKTLVNRTFSLWPEMKFWNLYGPTEATANISVYKVEPGKDVYLGTCIRGGNILLLDANLQHVPDGEEGFVYISSRALARGYLNNPALNQQNFITDHGIAGLEGATIYNTGDIGKYNSEGELLYLGRRDQQVKIRGYRIELSEIEKTLNHLDGVRQAACKVITDGNGVQKIVAFIVAVAQHLQIDKLRSRLAIDLPPYMIPEAFHFLEAMPQLANSKIDRSKLVEKVNDRPDLSYVKTNPTSAAENVLLDIWQDVLGLENLGMDDDFFDLGGNSLKMIKLINLVQQKFNKTLTFNDIWECATPHKIMAVMMGKAVDQADQHVWATHADKKNTVPLSFNQTGIWFILQSRPDQTAYNMLFVMDLKGALLFDTIQKVLLEMLKKHDILRSNFKIENRTPVRIIHDDAHLNIEYFDIVTAVAAEQEVYCHELAEKLLNEYVNLSEDALIKFRVVKLGSQHHQLFVQVHHIVFDGISIGLFTAEFWRHYEAMISSESVVEGSSKTYSYGDYEQWFKKGYFKGLQDESARFWKEKLRNAPYFLNFPIDYPRPKIQQFKGKNKVLVLDQSFLDRLTTFRRKFKVTPFITLLSAFKALVYRYTQQEDILVGVPFANRQADESKSIIGLFVNTVVYRAQFTEELSFSGLLDQVKHYTLLALPHQQYPFEKLVELLNPERSVSYNPVFQVMFAYHDKLESRRTSDGLVIETVERQHSSCKFDLDVEAQAYEDRVEINFNYNSSLFSDQTITLFIDQYLFLLEQVMLEPDATISTIPLQREESLMAQLEAWNDTTVPISTDCLHQRLEHMAAKDPHRIAVSIDQQEMTYQMLNERANQVAWFLRGKGIMANEVVAIIAERSFEMIIGIYGVLKAGAAYLPIDPHHPIERINYFLSDSRASTVLMQTSFDRDLVFSGELYCLDDLFPFSDEPVGNPPITILPSDLAYVIYTSGSTGKPKGAMISHQAVINRLDWMQKNYPLDKEDVILQKTPFTFDVSVWELFWWSFNGASMHFLAPGAEKNPALILAAIEDKKVTTIHFVPAMFNVFLGFIADQGHSAKKLSSLKTVFTSGEALERYHVEKFKTHFSESDVRLINLYGPTEATIDVSYFDCGHSDRYAKIPIGKPIDNTQLYVLDKNGMPLPEKIAGELCIGGVGLAEGYIHNASLTNEKFFFNAFNGDRLYRTGDLARWLPDGNIEYIGRRDQQVKIRGFRIELGEIENCMLKHAAVNAAVVVLKKFSQDDVRIVVYYTLKQANGEVDFKAYLRAFLPDYMVPSKFMRMEELPFLSNGKLDHQSLPEPKDAKEQVFAERVYANDYEQRLARIWQELLKTDGFSLEDNFYDAGGHSLLLINMKHFVDQEFGIDISIVDLFQYPTIRMLAEVIASAKITKVKSDIATRAAKQRQARLILKKI